MTGYGGGRRDADPVAQLRSLVAATVAGHLRLASRLSGLIWEPVLDGLAAAARPPGTPAPAGSGVVRLEAHRGEVLTIPFAVENRHDPPVDVTVVAEASGTAVGKSVPPDAVSFDPVAVTLRPGGHVVVRATVHVTDRFAVGEVYSTAFQVRNMPALPVPVEIVVVPGRVSSPP